MATYDPIIRFYDDPGHPYWPSKNGDSGGGSTTDLGPLQAWLTATKGVPIVGQSISANLKDPPFFVSASVGQSVVIATGATFIFALNVAAGAKVIAKYAIDDNISFNPNDDGTLFYAVSAQGSTYASVRPLDVDYQLTSDENYIYITFTMPELDEEEQLACNVSTSGGGGGDVS